MVEGYKHSDEVLLKLDTMREDFVAVTGKRFANFFCPILWKDEHTELCMGHVLNEAHDKFFKGKEKTFKGKLVQRADVDGFYGSYFESDFTARVQVMPRSVRECLEKPELYKKLNPKLIMGGEEVEHYLDRSRYKNELPEGHTPFPLNIGEGEPFPFVVKKELEEVKRLMAIGFELRLGEDCRVAAVVSLMKSGYLTLFKVLGYSYALNPDGRKLGQEILGGFFLSNRGKSKDAIVAAGKEFFRPYVNVMRIIHGFDGPQRRGTVEDTCARLCSDASDTIFGIIVTLRANLFFFDVLLPYFDKPEGAKAYDDFISTENQSLRVHECRVERNRLQAAPTPKVIVWPKSKDFTFD